MNQPSHDPLDTVPTKYALTGIGGGTAALIRDYAAPFVEELLADAATEGHATDLTHITVDGTQVDFAPTPRPPAMAGTTELIVGLATAVGGGLTAAIIDNLYTDLYDKLLKRPLANLVRRLRNSRTNPDHTPINIVVETWFAQDEVLVQIVIRQNLADIDDCDAAPTLRAALTTARHFLEHPDPSSAAPDPTDPERHRRPTTLRITINPDGTPDDPTYLDPRRRSPQG